MVRCQLRQKSGVNFVGGEAASPTKTKKIRTEKRKINIQTIREMHLPVITNEQVHSPGWTLDRFIKINLYSTYLQNLTTSIPRVTNLTRKTPHDIHES